MTAISRKTHIFCLLFIMLAAYGQKAVKMTTSATEMFKTDAFELEIRFENFESDISVQYPAFSDLLKISGPYQSSSTSIINGAMTKSMVLTYQFAPKRTGKITIEPAVVTDGGKKYSSNSITINVLEPGQAGSGDPRELFITAKVSGDDVYVGEMIRIDYTLYVKPEIKINMPSLSEEPKFTNFVKENIEIPQDQARTLTQVIYKGQKYNTLPLRSYWISPTSSGDRKIEALSAVVPVEVRSKKRKSAFNDPFFNDPFFSDDIFSGFSNFKERPVLSEEVNIRVSPLPAEGRPGNFAGAVGNYKFTASADKDSVQVNDAVTLKITISGKGNLGDIAVFKPEIPKDFEVYDPKRTVVFDKNSKNSGKVVFEYLLLARNPGRQKITGLSFSFFDPSEKKYKILTSGDIVIGVGGEAVQARNGSGFSRREVEVLASDIRYIKKSAGTFYSVSERGLTAAELSVHGGGAVLLIILSLTLSCYINRNSGNRARARNRKAVRNAMKRLKASYRSLENNDSAEFYRNLDGALLKFIADKFNISHAGIIVDEIISALSEKGVEDQVLEEMRRILNKSASIQFAPVKPDLGEMSGDIASVKDIMTNINEKLRKVTK